jgi:ribose transport system ATP-binding protein
MLGFGQLSGGNQQKVLLAKWIQESPEVLILHEPTQGVDVGARQQLYRHIEKAAQKGSAVICCSSDYEQLEQICDRVLIMVKGKIVKELTGEEISKEKITQLCYESEIA